MPQLGFTERRTEGRAWLDRADRSCARVVANAMAHRTLYHCLPPSLHTPPPTPTLLPTPAHNANQQHTQQTHTPHPDENTQSRQQSQKVTHLPGFFLSLMDLMGIGCERTCFPLLGPMEIEGGARPPRGVGGSWAGPGGGQGCWGPRYGFQHEAPKIYWEPFGGPILGSPSGVPHCAGVGALPPPGS